jgi:hypothetical protein
MLSLRTRLVLRVVRDTLVQQERLAAVCRAAAAVLEARARRDHRIARPSGTSPSR